MRQSIHNLFTVYREHVFVVFNASKTIAGTIPLGMFLTVLHAAPALTSFTAPGSLGSLGSIDPSCFVYCTQKYGDVVTIKQSNICASQQFDKYPQTSDKLAVRFSGSTYVGGDEQQDDGICSDSLEFILSSLDMKCYSSYVKDGMPRAINVEGRVDLSKSGQLIYLGDLSTNAYVTKKKEITYIAVSFFYKSEKIEIGWPLTFNDSGNMNFVLNQWSFFKGGRSGSCVLQHHDDSVEQ